jgi:predicted nucleic-acid-binding protein
MKVTLDTNVLIRLATKDDPSQAAVAEQALAKCSLIAVPNAVFCEFVWVLVRGYRYSPQQAAHAVRMLIQMRDVVCNTPAVLAGLAFLDNGGDFADGVIAFDGELLGGIEFMSFDHKAVKLLKAQKRKARLLETT